ncbi:MAG: group II truncated hemoglobin [Hyphomonadaceae bacterium]|nr:group II truncated hemoglobin [Hyphomonadaceae bacterium]
MSEPTPYELLGGDDGVRRLATRFYEIMAGRPEAAAVRGMHDDDLAPITENLYGFLRGWTGGPRDWFERTDAPCIMSLHRRLPIGEAERDQWLDCMNRAIEETVASPDARELLQPAFTRIADAMRSR